MSVSKLVKVLLALVVGSFALHGRLASAASPSPKKPVAAKPTSAKPTETKAAETKPAETKAAETKPAPRTVELKVTEEGYLPSPISLKKGEPVRLLVTRTEEHTCATELVMDEYGINTPLPLGQQVEIAFTPNTSGKLKYGCAMGKMISGMFVIE